MNHKVNVTGNAINGTITITLVFKSSNSKTSSSTRTIPVHGQVGDALQYSPSDYAPYKSLSKPITLQLTAKDAPNGTNNNYHKNIRFIYQVQKAAPITLECITQNGKKIMRQINGYVGEHGKNITNIAPLPKGYNLDAGQLTAYNFLSKPQKIILRVIGKPTTGIVHLTLDKYKESKFINSVQKDIKINGLIGDHYKIRASSYIPKGCTLKHPKIIQGTFTSTGITNSTALFEYQIITHPSSVKPTKQSALGIMTFDPNGRQISSNVITGNVGEKVDLTTYHNLALNKGYVLKPGQLKQDVIRPNLKVDKLYVEKKVSLPKVSASKALSYVDQTNAASSAVNSLQQNIVSLPSTSARKSFGDQLSRDKINISLLAKNAVAAKLISRAMVLAANDAHQHNDQIKYNKKVYNLSSATSQASEDASMANSIAKPDRTKYQSLLSSKGQQAKAPDASTIKPFNTNNSTYKDYNQLMSAAKELETSPLTSANYSQSKQSFTSDDLRTMTKTTNMIRHISQRISSRCSQANSEAFYMTKKASENKLKLPIKKALDNGWPLLSKASSLAHTIARSLKKASDKGTYMDTHNHYCLPSSKIVSIATRLSDDASLSSREINKICDQFHTLYRKASKSQQDSHPSPMSSSKIGNTSSVNLQIAYISKYTANIQRVVNGLIKKIRETLSSHSELNDTTTDRISSSAETLARDINQITSGVSTMIATNKIQQAIRAVQQISVKVNNIRADVTKVNYQKCQNAMLLYHRTRQNYNHLSQKINTMRKHKKSHKNIGIQAAKDRDAFERGALDAHKSGRPVEAQRKKDPAAYEAGYRAYTNGYYDAAGDLTYYADRYQGLSQSAYADGFSNGETYFNDTAQFNNESQIKPNIKKHKQSIKLANIQGNNLDVLPQPKDSDKTPQELKVMAAVLGILLINGVAYEREHNLESYNDKLNDLS